MARSKRKKKGRRGFSRRSASPSGSPGLWDRLDRADQLLEEERWEEACETLEKLNERYPRRPEVLSRLADAYYHLDDLESWLPVCRQLAAALPDDPDVQLMLASACQANELATLALRAFQRFLRRWPKDPRAEEVAKTAAELETLIRAGLAERGVTGDDALDVAALLDQMREATAQGEYAEVRQAGQQLLRIRPDYVPALNNLGEVFFREGQIDEAIATARRALTLEPDNFHATSNLTRYLSLGGRVEEAKSLADKLKSLDCGDTDGWLKRAEALTFLGDDQGVLDAFAEADRRKLPDDNGLFSHLAAVAHARLGREAEAKRLWKRASQASPGLDLADGNLENLRLPADERHSPWAYTLPYWLPHTLVQGLSDRLGRVLKAGGDQALKRETKAFLANHPHLAAVVPMMLDRGDPDSARFALNLAQMAETPELLAALRDFALGQRGSEKLRWEAARKAVDAGLVPAGPVRMWLKGQWGEVLLLGFEIHEEAVGHHSRKVEDWLSEAIGAVHEHDPLRAERLLNKALEAEPDAPDVVNNLAQVYEALGRKEQSRALIRQNYERHPDYLFGRLNFAHLLILSGQIEQAKELIDPLLQRKRFHLSEFGGLCGAEIHLALAQKNRESAGAWLEMWEGVDAESPALAMWRRRVEGGLLRTLLGGLRPRDPFRTSRRGEL